MDAGAFYMYGSYAHRFNRWTQDGGGPTVPALLGGDSLASGEKYVYSDDPGPLARHPGAAILSDSFFQSSSSSQPNEINDYHETGLNVGYADGHAEWVADKNHQLALLKTTASNKSFHRMCSKEDFIWNAMDGGIGPQTYSQYQSGFWWGVQFMK